MRSKCAIVLRLKGSRAWLKSEWLSVVVAKLGLQLRLGFRAFEIAWPHPSVRSAKEPFVLPMVETKSTVIGCVCCEQAAFRLLCAGLYTTAGMDQLERDPAGQGPTGRVQLDRDQLFARDRFSTDKVFFRV